MLTCSHSFNSSSVVMWVGMRPCASSGSSGVVPYPASIFSAIPQRPWPVRKQLLGQIPAGRFGTAEQVADLVVFLVSDGASYITGQVLRVSGGLD